MLYYYIYYNRCIFEFNIPFFLNKCLLRIILKEIGSFLIKTQKKHQKRVGLILEKSFYNAYNKI
ncbi:Conserved hypothetical protein [Clostridium acetobutylicum EA 2018]|uniref:Uncharacterized protein n=1 Tax=Clostridium acetobutylicum (strain ATCC 824 / DSM 792 / JCM 1419 / IAM 19013 / LMG 5710 / NBRC 13948 / NRRL B-527 / VKM B-1787 / 2291 / W) TaxID=272562 RepID=Q97D47_CLOAB|nr:Hypothetical protein CA_C3633 [Clostridium acetobutylicum ATCC 824]ADZ22677.1 Conserved hypothetical protein [Clostridium acetobutylicum EA 2018]AEI32964.1 hypothetical protein SMB_G3674 [Clostridium acetobutylicum DSM 1731]AWV80771.1 hypothetical protein DK921_11795 [Clostridium acetobutylicum]PSM05360.1 hypothetical protein C7T89_11795 [Clostridium sp. NJ4]